jgi:hypothetical protein
MAARMARWAGGLVVDARESRIQGLDFWDFRNREGERPREPRLLTGPQEITARADTRPPDAGC